MASACVSFLGESSVSLPRHPSHSLQVQEQWPCLESVALSPRPVGSEARISAAHNEEKQKDLGKEPGPASAACVVLGLELVSCVRLAGATGIRAAVQVLGRDGDDVVVVAQLAGLGAEAQVGNVGDRRGVVHLEAHQPVAHGLVLELELEALVLEVGQSHLGGDARVAETSGRAASQLRLLAVVVLVVGLLSVSKHGHDIGEDDAGAVVLVRVDENAQALELVGVAKDRSELASLLGDPHGEAIAIQLVLAMDLELDLDFPVGRCERYS